MGAEFTKTLIVDPPGGDAVYHTIKEAVAALGNNGGVIIVEQGEYDFDQEDDYDNGNTNTRTTVYIPDDVTIIGRGNVILNVERYDISVFRNADRTNGNEKITISGFKIEIDPDPEVEEHYDNNVIDLRNVSKCVIENVYIKGVFTSFGVDSGNAAIKFNGEEGKLCTGNVISDCIVENFGKSTNYGHGIYLDDHCEENMINNNSIIACQKNIYFDEAHNNSVSNNALTQAKDDGFYVYKSNYTSIFGNKISKNSDFGINVYQSQGCSIQGNICYDNDEDGIRICGTSTASLQANYNTIVGNSCYENRGNNQNGIYLKDYAKRNVVNGNTCYNNSGDGIKEDSSVDGAERNLIVANICYENDSGDEITIGANTDIICANNKTD